MAKYKLYTHTDLDGVGCAVLAKLMWKDEIDIEYCNNPNDVTDKLNKVKQKDFDIIFVTDCSFNYSDVNNKFDFNRLKLFDHHNTAKYLEEKIPFAKVEEEVDGKATCGTELFYNYLKHKGLSKNADYFVEQVRLYDTWDWAKGTSHIPKYLSMLVYMFSITRFVKEYTRRLNKADLNELTIFTQYERDVLEYEIERQDRELKKQLKQVHIIDTSNYKIGVIVGDYNMSLLGNAICDTFDDVDIAVGINLMRGGISVRTNRDEIDLGKFMETYFKGGGHLKSAGGCLSLSYNNIAGIYDIMLDSKFGFITGVKKVGNDKNYDTI